MLRMALYLFTREDLPYNIRAMHLYNFVIFIRDIYFYCICHSGYFPLYNV